MKWITRERVKVDRVACPWLIKKFVDPQAEFLFVPADKVLETAERKGATPYDVPNVEFGHQGKECSFDANVKNRTGVEQHSRVHGRRWPGSCLRARHRTGQRHHAVCQGAESFGYGVHERHDKTCGVLAGRGQPVPA